ncbi:MAG: hypothetical protein EXS05_20950 [Planctomycetaceae bacterium]|nr:hypothetical protein [Planctomycetaceae bacterium]
MPLPLSGRFASPADDALNVRSFFAAPVHEEAVARILYLAEQAPGCGVLCGPDGTGKSLVLRVARDEATRMQIRVVLVDAGGRTAHELLWETASSLGLCPQGSEHPLGLWRMLGDHLLANRHVGVPTLLCFDHLDRADSSSLSAIERIYRTSQASNAGISLLLVARQSRSLAGLIPLADIRIELTPLDRRQTGRYLAARLACVGRDRSTFDESAVDATFAVTGGVPRDINRVCNLALLAATGDGTDRVTGETVNALARQFLDAGGDPPRWEVSRLRAKAG